VGFVSALLKNEFEFGRSPASGNTGYQKDLSKRKNECKLESV